MAKSIGWIFFDNTNKLGEVFTPPFTLNLASLGAGHHLLTAVALDNLGAMATSAPVAFSASLPAVVSVDDPAVIEGNTGSTSMVFTVSLASPSCRTIKPGRYPTNDADARNGDFLDGVVIANRDFKHRRLSDDGGHGFTTWRRQ